MQLIYKFLGSEHKVKKKFGIIFLCILTIVFIGCNKTESKVDESMIKQLVFDDAKAKQVAENYMKYLSQNDFENARSLCKTELANKIKDFNTRGFNILSFKLGEIVQKGDSTMYEFIITRTKEGETRADLEDYYISVSRDKEKDKYEVSDVKATTKIEGFVEKNKLRIRNNDDVKTKTVIKLSNIPSEMYPKYNKANIVKLPIPKSAFGPMNFTFLGDKIAITSKGNNKTYIATIEIDESQSTQGSEGKGGGGAASEGAEGSSTEGEDKVLEPIIGKKITSVDIYQDINVKNLIFSKEQGYLAVIYEDRGATQFKLYDEKGNITDIDFDKLFPAPKYHVLYEDCKESYVLFHVKGVEGAKDVRQDVTGKYKISLKDSKLTKL